MKRLFLLIILFNTTALTQENNIAQFAVWKPKEGQEQKFEAGYKQHLLWHKNNGDLWSWYGWYIVSGSRSGQFVDATVDRAWNDFNSPVKPAEDAADNRLHTFPFGDFQTVFKVSKITRLSSAGNSALKSKVIRFVTLSAGDMPEGLKLVEKLKNKYATDFQVKNFQTYKMIDGGNANQIILMIGFSDYVEYGKTENLQEDLSVIEASLKTKVITAVNSETLIYRADMSLFTDTEKPISSTTAEVDAKEKELAKVPLESYLKAHATGNGDFFRQAFHKEGRIMAFRDGKFVNLSVEEFAARVFPGKPADDEARRKRSFEILEISGNAAIARVSLDYPTIKFTDYMSLLKIDGEWKIVNKSFYAEPKK